MTKQTKHTYYLYRWNYWNDKRSETGALKAFDFDNLIR